MTKVWQIAAGDEGRDYSGLFLEYDLMSVGPSYPGPFDRAVYEKAAETNERIRGFVLRRLQKFCNVVAPGDLVLLRRGQRVIALGVVHADGYRHDEAFDDIHGWDVGHTRRVVWQTQLREDLDGLPPLFAAVRMPAFSRVFEEPVLAGLKGLFERCEDRPLRLRPPELPRHLTLAELGAALAEHGLAGADRVVEAVARQRRLMTWYRSLGRASGRPSEHEVVAYLIVPLLQALGWPEEQLAIEWRRVDVAGFARAPNTPDNCVLVCEAKELTHGLLNVGEQAKRYIAEHKLASCNRILVTQGPRLYLLRRRTDGEWPLTGYVNLEKLRTDHVVAPGADAVATLMSLTPAAVLAAEPEEG